MPTILVTGGSGYLGQFLVQALTRISGNDVIFAYHSRVPSDAELALLGNPRVAKVDLKSGDGLQQCVSAEGKLPDVVINCAAISIPRDCETDPDSARALNIPRSLLTWLNQHSSPPSLPLLIHLSTDQVYSGTKAWWSEEDELSPVNLYGETKVDAEKEIQRHWGNYAILRSSIIVGPTAPAIPLPKTPPLLWMDKALSSGQANTFFVDEFRCPVFVQDLVNVSLNLIHKAQSGPLTLVLNSGGPDRLSRAGMAEVVAQVRGYAHATPEDVAQGAVEVKGPGEESGPTLPALSTLVTRVPASSAGNRGVRSPADISMKTERIVAETGLSLTPFAEAVRISFQERQ